MYRYTGVPKSIIQYFHKNVAVTYIKDLLIFFLQLTQWCTRRLKYYLKMACFIYKTLLK